jgi:hypothetical protein
MQSASRGIGPPSRYKRPLVFMALNTLCKVKEYMWEAKDNDVITYHPFGVKGSVGSHFGPSPNYLTESMNMSTIITSHRVMVFKHTSMYLVTNLIKIPSILDSKKLNNDYICVHYHLKCTRILMKWSYRFIISC